MVIYIGSSTLLEYENFSARWRAGGRSAPSVNLGPPHISETIRDRKLKFSTHLDGPNTLFGNENFSARGVAGVQRPLM